MVKWRVLPRPSRGSRCKFYHIRGGDPDRSRRKRLVFVMSDTCHHRNRLYIRSKQADILATDARFVSWAQHLPPRSRNFVKPVDNKRKRLRLENRSKN